MAIKQTWDLELDYDIRWEVASGYVKNRYTATTGAAKFPYLWAWGKANGWTDSDLLNLSEFVAAWNDVIWHSANGDYTIQPVLGHGWNINAPHGKFPINYPLIIAGGEYVGRGSRIFYSSVAHGFGGTELYVDHANWMTSKAVDRHIMRTTTWGQNGMFAYQESFKVRSFRLSGERQSGWMDTAYESSGIAVWEAGETSRIDDIYCYRFNSDGLLFVRGTPVLCTNISVFMCNRSAIAMIGGAGATYTFLGVSGDDCPASFYMRDGYGRIGGGLLTVIGTKSETGLTDQFKPYKAQMLLDGEGWVVAEFRGVSLASGNIFPDSLVRVKHTANVSSVEVSNLRLFGNRRTIMHDSLNNKKWLFDRGGFTNIYTSFYWISDANGVFIPKYGNPTQVSAPFKERLGYLYGDPVTGQPIGTFDDVLGLPPFSYTGEANTGITSSITSVNTTASVSTINEGTTSILTAIVNGVGSYNNKVTWSIVSGGGSLLNATDTQVNYLAPSVTADSTATVRATAVGDTTKSSDISLTIKNVASTSTITSVVLSSTLTTVTSNQTTTINATVNGTGSFSNGLTWSIVSGGGTITPNGVSAVYTAPTVTSNQSAVIRATSTQDSTKFGNITISVRPASTSGSITGVTIVGTGGNTMKEGEAKVLTASLQGTGNFANSVNWSIVSGGGSLTNTSALQTTYNAPQVTTNATAQVKAVATANVSKTSTYSITVQDVPVGSSKNIDPNKMGIVINIDNPTSKAIADEYMLRWGIPASNVVQVNLGNTDNVTSAIAAVAKNKLSTLPAGVQWLALCWDKPSRVDNTNSITWVMTNGFNSISTSGSLPTNPMFGYTGNQPFTEKGVRPSMLVVSAALVQKAKSAHAKRPTGTCYMMAANDQSGQPRGRSRLTQMQALNGSTQYAGVGFNFTNSLSGPAGETPTNNILNKADMLFYFNGMYKIYGMETNTIKNGAVGDYVTSTSGTLPDGAGQTPITYMIQNGFVGSLGTVVEPWQSGLPAGSSNGGLVEQFTNIQTFIPLYYEGRSLVDAYWKSVKWPTRTLFMGDPMVAPWGTDLGGTTPILGCTDPTAINYNPAATMNDGTCQYVTPPSGSLAKYSFESDSTPILLKADVGANLSQATGWKQAKISAGKMIVDNYNVTYPMNLPLVKKIVYRNITFTKAHNYEYLNNFIRIDVSGRAYDETNNLTIATSIPVNVNIPELILPLATPATITSLVGSGIEATNGPCYFTVDQIEFLSA